MFSLRYLSFNLLLGGKKLWTSMSEILIRPPSEDERPLGKLKFDFAERVDSVDDSDPVMAGDSAVFKVGVLAPLGWSNFNVEFKGLAEKGIMIN